MTKLEEMIYTLKNNEGFTFKDFNPIRYKTGWQVGIEGIITRFPDEAIQAIKKYGGNCGIWYENGVYYVDKSIRITTKKQALEVGRVNGQISIYSWKNIKKTLAYC